ncbi:hypothetical protein TcG_08249, partial [Trypanosoma cruzi]
ACTWHPSRHCVPSFRVMSQLSWQHLPSPALSVTIRMAAKTAMRMMMVCTERQIVCVSWLHESQEGLDAVPTIPGPAELLAFALSLAVISAHALGLIRLPWS